MQYRPGLLGGEVCVNPSDYDGGLGPDSYFEHAMSKDD
jgi:hypothetical protein